MENITVCGADWCGDTQATLALLDNVGVRYEYRNVDEDSAADAWVRAQNGGARKLPTVDIGGEILSIPDEAELADALRGHGVPV